MARLCLCNAEVSEGLPESDGEGKGERERQSESRKTAKLKSSIGMPRKCDDCEEILTLTREGQIRKSRS
jgi:hypothetical protein